MAPHVHLKKVDLNSLLLCIVVIPVRFARIGLLFSINSTKENHLNIDIAGIRTYNLPLPQSRVKI